MDVLISIKKLTRLISLLVKRFFTRVIITIIYLTIINK